MEETFSQQKDVFMSNIKVFLQGDVSLDFGHLNVPMTVICGATGCGKSLLMDGIIKDLKSRRYDSRFDKPKIFAIDNTSDVRKNLEDVLQEINRRLEVFAKYGSSSYAEYCFSRGDMAEIIVAVDAMRLIQDDEDAMKMLSEIVEKVKTAGAHIIIASQTPNIKGVTDLGYWVQRVIFTSHNYGELGWDGVPQNFGSCFVCLPTNVAV